MKVSNHQNKQSGKLHFFLFKLGPHFWKRGIISHNRLVIVMHFQDVSLCAERVITIPYLRNPNSPRFKCLVLIPFWTS